MMVKLSIFATTLLLLLAIYQTIIFANEEESKYGQSQKGQRCRQRIQSQQFRQCEQYLRQQQQGRDELIFRGIRNQQPHNQQSLQQCCQALENIDEQCQCEGLKKIVHRQQQQGQLQGQQLREMMQRTKELPQMCGTGQTCRDVDELPWF